MAGYFYLGAYTPDRLRVIPRPVDGLAKAADCNQNEFIIPETSLGSVTFSADGSAPGCNPCLQSCTQPTPTQSVSWGAIKSLYQER